MRRTQRTSGACAAGAVLFAVVLALVGFRAEAADEPGSELGLAALLEREIAALSAIPSRLSGTEGCDRAAEYIRTRFKQIGLTHIAEQPFDVVVPITKHCSMLLGDAKTPVEVFPLWPNWTRTCTTPGPMECAVIYAGQGTLRELAGLPIADSIVILEHNTSAEWQKLCDFGPRAFLFVEPDPESSGAATRVHAERKFLRNPLNMPRFWVPREGTKLTAGELVRRVSEAQDKYLQAWRAGEKTPPPLLHAVLDCRVDWETRTARNIVGLLRGTDARETDSFVAFSAHYDSISIAPDLAPGADGSGGIAALLCLAQRLAANPGRENVLFIATAGHYQALRGATILADTLAYSSVGEAATADQREKGARMLQAIDELDKVTTETADLSPDLRAAARHAVRLLRSAAALLGYSAPAGRSELAGRIRQLEEDLIDREGRTAAYDGLAKRIRGIEGLEPDLAGKMLAQVDALKQRLLADVSSYQNYEELFRLIQSAKGISSAARRGLRYAVEHEQDADRHIAAYRFELVRLRKHQMFLEQLGLDLKRQLRIVYSIDLSGDGTRFAVFSAPEDGLIAQALNVQSIYGALMRNIWQIGRKRTGPEGDAQQFDRIVYTASPTEEGRMGGYFVGKPAFDSEMFQLAGREALAFATVDCGWTRVDTPTDTVRWMKALGGFERLAAQVDVLCELVERMATASEVRSIYRTLDNRRAAGRSPLFDYSCRVNGRVVLYDMKRSLGTADVPVPGALCVARFARASGEGRSFGAQSYIGVRDGYMTFSSEGGTFEMLGLPHDRARAYATKQFEFGAYKFNQDPASEEFGEIDHAPDLGPQGAQQQFKIVHAIPKDDFEVAVPVFRCRPVGLFGFVDPLSAADYGSIVLYDAKTNTAPDYYGLSLFPEPSAASQGVPAGVVFLQPSVRFKLQFTAGALGATSPLVYVRGGEHLNADGAEAGYGYEFPQKVERGSEPTAFRENHVRYGVLRNMRLLMTRDVVNLDEYRIAALARHAVTNNRVNELHFGREGDEAVQGAKRYLEAAEAALATREYEAFSANLETALAMESRAYPIVKRTTTDILTGVLFYLFLLLPFSYFAERLVFGFPDVNRRLAGFFGFFILVFIILALVHPAFAVTRGAPVILIAFITIALSILVIAMIRSRFEREIRLLHERPGARRQADFKRASATSAACALGIGNMRRRKTRTGLTLATLVLLTFSVLSFTSVDPRQVTHENPNPTGEEIVPPYAGVLLRDPRYTSLSPYLYDLARNEFGREATVAPRAWLTTDAYLSNAEDPQKGFLCTGVVGTPPDERKVTAPDTHLLAGRWFRGAERPACVIGERVAAALGIRRADVTGELTGAPRLRMLGIELPVIGLTDDRSFARLTDIDGEQLSPVDRREEGWMKRSGTAFNIYAADTYNHVEPENCVFVPYDFLIGSGGTLVSVAIAPEAADEAGRSQKAEAIGRNLLSRLTRPIYISKGSPLGGVTYALSSDANRVRGLGSLLVPMLICAMIVLNTMLGSVYERQREISIFGSLGLAPLHIGSLFVAESAVFATIAVILGYVLGQAVSFLLANTALLAGFSLNYSSISAVISAAAVMALVLLSAIYPARKASQLSVPDVERIWKLPPPEGDDFHIDFPFTIGGEQAFGINMFLLEYFRDHANQSVGDFFAQDSTISLERSGVAYAIRFDSQVWIAPFDFGISQSLTLRTVPTDEAGIYAPEMHLHRKSGEPAAWARMNHRFLKLLRQQFLMWRILTNEEREWFAARAKVVLGIATDEDRRIAERDPGKVAAAEDPETKEA